MLAGIDPSIAAMYGLAMPPTPSSSSSNGIGASSSSKGASSGSSSKPKPGTVAAALEEKKKSKGQSTTSNSMTHDNEYGNDRNMDEPVSNKKSSDSSKDEDTTGRAEEDIGEENNEYDGEKEKGEARKGLTSDERVLLREKKRQRLAKEQETVDSPIS